MNIAEMKELAEWHEEKARRSISDWGYGGITHTRHEESAAIIRFAIKVLEKKPLGEAALMMCARAGEQLIIKPTLGDDNEQS